MPSSQRDECLVYGYMRTGRQSISTKDIWSLCFQFFHIEPECKGFNKKYFDADLDRLQFVDDNTIRTVRHKDYTMTNGFTLCFYDEEITPEICNEFALTVTINKEGGGLIIGYITTSPKEYLANLYKHTSKDPRAGNWWLGSGGNKGKSVGFSITMGSTYIEVHDDLPDKSDIYQGCNNQIISHPFNTQQYMDGFGEGDELQFIFNFKKNEIKLCCNGQKLLTKSLKWCTNFIPAFMFEDNNMR